MVLIASTSILRLGYVIGYRGSKWWRRKGCGTAVWVTDDFIYTLRCRVGPGPLVVGMTPGYFIAPMRQAREGREAE